MVKVVNSSVSGPLSHVLILDLTTFLAGPYCTQILADLGARVIKIERREGDFSRSIPPHFVKGTSAYFHSINRNKESVVIDLKKSEGLDIVLKLVRKVDVVVENFRPGVMKRLGLDYERLAEINPGIVMCSISGFGQDGPYKERPAYDMMVQAISGSMSINGEPGRRPMRLGVPLGDLAAGMYGAIGILSALAERSVNGKGQYVDVAMLDCQVSMLSYLGVYYLISGEVPDLQGRGHVSIPTYRSFSCADGVDVIVTANTEKMWQSLCEMLNLPELIQDPRFRSNEDRLQNKEVLWKKLEAGFLTKTSDEWLKLANEFDIPVAQVNTVDRAFADPQVRHRNMVIEVNHPDGDRMQLIGNPIKLPQTSSESFNWPPKLGGDTSEVLIDLLEMTREEISVLENDEVIYSS